VFPADYQPHYITVTSDGDVTIVSFSLAELTDDENIEILGRELFYLVDQLECRKILLDMQGVAFITSSVLGKIITLHRKQSRNEGRLVLCNLEDGVIDTLKTSRLITYFETADDRSTALERMG